MGPRSIPLTPSGGATVVSSHLVRSVWRPSEQVHGSDLLDVGLASERMRSALSTLVACILLSASLGSIHAYSLFIDSFEVELNASRGSVSAVYSTALVSLTVAVLVGHPLFRRLSGSFVALIVSGGASSGLLVAAWSPSLGGVIVGYGVIFGIANGLGYAFSLQRAAEANPERKGFALGWVTAAYALGAAVAAALLEGPIESAGASRALNSLALTIITAGLIASFFLVGSDRSSTAGKEWINPPKLWRLLGRLWTGYGLATVAGLMTLGHAAEIVDQAGGPGGAATVLVGCASGAGGIWVAFVANRSRIRWLITRLPLGSTIALGIGALIDNGTVVVATIAFVAFAYGALIAAYPFAVNEIFGSERYPATYGRVFTAWGVAGLIGPFGAGLLFDMTGAYRLPLLLAGTAALGSCLVGRRILP